MTSSRPVARSIRASSPRCSRRDRRLTDAQHDRHRDPGAARARLRASPATSSAGSGCCRTTRARGGSSGRPDGSLVVSFVARRPLIEVLGLGLPVTWRPAPGPSPDACACASSTSPGRPAGWTSRGGSSRPATPDARVDRARLPAAGPVLRRVRRPRLHATDRGPDARHVQGARRGAPGRRVRRRRSDHRHDRPAARLDHRARGHHRRAGPASTRSGPGCAPPARRSSGSTASTRARSAARSRPRSTTSTRSPGCRPRPPGSSTGSASSGWWPAASRSTTPA